MNNILEIAGGILLVIGSIFLFLGALGIYRMPDVYNRLQAGTKATTLGAMSSILGIGLLSPGWIMKILIIIIFIAFSNPISSHALARAMHKIKAFAYYKGEEIDSYKEVEDQIDKENNKKA